MFIEQESIQHQNVVSRLAIMDSLENFDTAWQGFHKEVYDTYGDMAQLPYYSLKYSRDGQFGVEMYAPVAHYNPHSSSTFRHYTYFEVGPLLGKRIMSGDEDLTIQAMEDIREHLIENSLIQTSPMFCVPQAEGEAGYTDIMVVYRPKGGGD